MPDYCFYNAFFAYTFNREQKGGLYQLPPSFIEGCRSNSLATYRYKSPFYLLIFSPMEIIGTYINNLAMYFAYHTTMIYSAFTICIIFLLILILKDYLKSKALINYSVGFMILCVICITILSRTGNDNIINNLLKQEEKYKIQNITCLKNFISGVAITSSDDSCLNFYKKFIGEMEKKKSMRSEVIEINKKIDEYTHYCDGVNILGAGDEEKKEACIEYALFSSL